MRPKNESLSFHLKLHTYCGLTKYEKTEGEWASLGGFVRLPATRTKAVCCFFFVCANATLSVIYSFLSIFSELSLPIFLQYILAKINCFILKNGITLPAKLNNCLKKNNPPDILCKPFRPLTSETRVLSVSICRESCGCRHIYTSGQAGKKASH